MEQASDETSVGYALKRAQARLHAVMEAALEPWGIGVSQYACLTLLDRRPGLSNAELARGVFVSRQATHQLLTGLRSAGLIETTGSGRGQRLSLSRRGRTVLQGAAARALEVERAMLAPLSAAEQSSLASALVACAEALEHTSIDDPLVR